MFSRSHSTSIQNVLFVAGVEEASLRYRVYLPAEALRRGGIASVVLYCTDPKLEERATEADLVILFRVRATKRILKLIDTLHKSATPVLFDIDDLVFSEVSAIPWLSTLSSVEANVIRRNSELLELTIAACDGVIASTDPLAREIEKLDVPSTVFPNGIGERLRELSNSALQLPTLDHPLRLGYLSGTFTHQADWQLIEPAVLGFLQRRLDAELWMVGQVHLTSALASLGDRVKLLPLVPWQHLPALTRQLDINLAPLDSGTFNECKSAIKWLEPALVEVPTIASNIPPYADIIEHEKSGLLATTKEDWIECLEQVANQEFRTKLGKQAREEAENKFGFDIQTERYGQVLQWANRLATGKRAETDLALDEAARPHALEPGDLTLIYSQTYPQLPTAPLRSGQVLTFQLPGANSLKIRLDLLFATYGRSGTDISLHIKDADNGELLGKTGVSAENIAEESWAAFSLNLTRPAKRLVIEVVLKKIESTEIGLWTTLQGSHQLNGRLRQGSPCVKLWVEEEAGSPATLPVVTAEPVTILQSTIARAKLVRYLSKVKGVKATLEQVKQTAAVKRHRKTRKVN